MKTEKENVFFLIYINICLIFSIVSWLIIILVNLNMLQINSIFYIVTLIVGIFVTAMTLTNINMFIDMKKFKKKAIKQIEEARKESEIRNKELMENIIEESKNKSISNFLSVVNQIKNNKENKND